MNRQLPGLIVFWCWLAFAGPLWAQSENDETEPTGSEAEKEAEEEAEEAEAEAPESYPRDTFRLYSRRDVGLRLRPNAGLRVPLVEPLFSPRTADFEDRERRQGPRSRYAVSASISVFGADGERGSYKAQEFRDLDQGVAVGVDAQVRTSRDWLRLTGRHLTLDDRDVLVEWRQLGISKTRLFFNRIPHQFAFDAVSLYSGIGSGRLTLAPGVQETLQASTSLADAAARLSDLVASAGHVDVGLVRNRLGLEFELTAFDPVSVKITVDDESRRGARPWSASFRLDSFVEIPWPVDYDLHNVRLALEYAKDGTLLRGDYYRSRFENAITSVVFDNPWRATDSGVPGPIYTFGPATGLIDLYPDNEQQEVTLTAVKSGLPGRSTLQATVAWNRMEQDDPLVPYTSNTAVVPGAPGNPPFDASDPANRPAASAGAKLESRLINVRWTSRPLDVLSVKAHFRDWEMENETARVALPGFVIEDLAWRPFFGAAGGAFTNLPIAQAKTSYGVELGFHLDHRTKVTLGWEKEKIDRQFREVEETEEDRFELAVVTKPAAWVDLRASYQRAERDAEEYDFDQFFTHQGIEFIPVLPFLRKFDQADRDRHRVQLMATFYPSESLVVGAQVIAGADDYPESRFGVLEDEHEIWAVDVSYAMSERLSFFCSYSSEKFEVEMRGREWFPFGPSDPFRSETGFESASNWTAETVDEVDTLTLGLDVDLIPDRLRLDLSYVYSRSDGAILYASPVAEVDLNPFDPADFPEVDDVDFYSLNPELELTISGHLSLSLAYLREKYEILDFNLEGFELVPVTPSGEFNGGLLMGTLPGNYDVEVVALKLKWEW